MGLLNLFKRDNTETELTRSALDEARDPGEDPGAVTALIQRILAVGLDGLGPFDGADKLADRATAKKGDSEGAIDWIARSGIRDAAGGGFVTSLGGFVTMPVAVPANVFEFYVFATRAVGAIAKLRGYDIGRPEIRTAILLTLVGSKSTDILAKAGVNVGSRAIGGLATKNLPKPAIMMINKAVGFQLLKSLGERTLARLGKAVPLAGGAFGAVVDGAMMSKIVDQARAEFPATIPPAQAKVDLNL